MTLVQIENIRRTVRITLAPHLAYTVGSPGACHGQNCVHSSGCGSCARVGSSCHECICAEILGTFALAGKVTIKNLASTRKLSAKKQAEYDGRIYWVSGLTIERCVAEKLSALGLQGGDTIEKIDGQRATNARMERFAKRVRLHSGTLLVYRQSESISFEIPYTVERHSKN